MNDVLDARGTHMDDQRDHGDAAGNQPPFITPTMHVRRSDSARENFRHSSSDTHINGRNRVSFPDGRRMHDAFDYSRDIHRVEGPDIPSEYMNNGDNVHSHRKFKQPATYDGRNSWRDYLVHFEW